MKKIIVLLSVIACCLSARAQTNAQIQSGYQPAVPTMFTNNATYTVASTNLIIYDLLSSQTVTIWFFSSGTNAGSSGVQTANMRFSPDGTNWTAVTGTNAVTATVSGVGQVMSITTKPVGWARFMEFYSFVNADATYNSQTNLIFFKIQ